MLDSRRVLVEVAVAAAVRGTFTYRVPSRLAGEAALGRRVAVPFGKSRRATGYVVGFPATPPPGVELRDVADVLDDFPLFTDELIKLIRWAEDYYLAPPGELLRAALPPGLNARRGAAAPARRGVEYAAPAARAAEAVDRLGPRARSQRAVLDYLLARGRIPVEELRAAFPRGRAALGALVRRGLAVLETVTPLPSGSLLPAAEAPLALTPAQSAALAAVSGAFGRFETFLLHGVTGSGKTEVYLQAIARVRAAGKGALVLVPEIALTPQLAGRFRARFGEAVALMHAASPIRSGTPSGCGCDAARPRSASGCAAPSSRPSRTSASWSWTRSTTAASSRRTAPPTTPATWPWCEPRWRTRSASSARRRRRWRRWKRPSRPLREARAPGAHRRPPLPEVRIVDLPATARGGRPPASSLRLSPRRSPRPSPPASRPSSSSTVAGSGRSWCAATAAAGPLRRLLRLPHLPRPARRPALPLLRPRDAVAAACPDCGGERTGVGVGTEQVEEAVRDLSPTRAWCGSTATR